MLMVEAPMGLPASVVEGAIGAVPGGHMLGTDRPSLRTLRADQIVEQAPSLARRLGLASGGREAYIKLAG